MVYALNSLAFEAQLRPYPNAPVQCLGISWQSSSDGTTAFRPADVLLDWDHLPRRTCVDVTIVSPILAHVSSTFYPGKAARIAEDSKYSKHSLACQDTGFGYLGFAADCFCCLAPDTTKTLTRLAYKIVPTIPSF